MNRCGLATGRAHAKIQDRGLRASCFCILVRLFSHFRRKAGTRSSWSIVRRRRNRVSIERIVAPYFERFCSNLFDGNLWRYCSLMKVDHLGKRNFGVGEVGIVEAFGENELLWRLGRRPLVYRNVEQLQEFLRRTSLSPLQIAKGIRNIGAMAIGISSLF